jgi:hypothetical protein
VTVTVAVMVLVLRASGGGHAAQVVTEPPEAAAAGPLVSARSSAPSPAKVAAEPPARPRPPPPPAAAATSSPAKPQPAATPEADDALMEKLRMLAGKDPEQILRLARAANARDPEGPHAPERAWMVVKSLTDLQRFSEAKDEAQTMVNRYPGTSWSMDVQRHLLSNPL